MYAIYIYIYIYMYVLMVDVWVNPLTINVPYHIETIRLICITNLTGEH